MNSLSSFSEKVFYKQFEEFLQTKYPEEYAIFTVEDKEDKFESIFMMGLHQAKKFHNTNQLAHLLWEDKPARADVVARLGNILWELQVIPSYPVVPPMALRTAIKKVVGKDPRYLNKYQACILGYSNQQLHLNKIDVTYLVSLVPTDKITKKEGW